jgi:hypothetical protein
VFAVQETAAAESATVTGVLEQRCRFCGGPIVGPAGDPRAICYACDDAPRRIALRSAILLVEDDTIREHEVPPEPEPEDRRTLATRRIRAGLRAPIVR